MYLIIQAIDHDSGYKALALGHCNAAGELIAVLEPLDPTQAGLLSPGKLDATTGRRRESRDWRVVSPLYDKRQWRVVSKPFTNEGEAIEEFDRLRRSVPGV